MFFSFTGVVPISPSAIKLVVGIAGATIRAIRERTNSQISIDRDNNQVQISAPSGTALNEAKSMVENVQKPLVLDEVRHSLYWPVYNRLLTLSFRYTPSASQLS